MSCYMYLLFHDNPDRKTKIQSDFNIECPLLFCQTIPHFYNKCSRPWRMIFFISLLMRERPPIDFLTFFFVKHTNSVSDSTTILQSQICF